MGWLCEAGLSMDSTAARSATLRPMGGRVADLAILPNGRARSRGRGGPGRSVDFSASRCAIGGRLAEKRPREGSNLHHQVNSLASYQLDYRANDRADVVRRRLNGIEKG